MMTRYTEESSRYLRSLLQMSQSNPENQTRHDAIHLAHIFLNDLVVYGTASKLSDFLRRSQAPDRRDSRSTSPTNLTEEECQAIEEILVCLEKEELHELEGAELTAFHELKTRFLQALRTDMNTLGYFYVIGKSMDDEERDRRRKLN